MIDAHEYVKAFQRNCPRIRPDKDEAEELRRLFHVAIEAARTHEGLEFAKWRAKMAELVMGAAP